MVKRGNAAAIPFLVLWKNLPLTETTWEYADELCLRFPEFHLEDKVMVCRGHCHSWKQKKKKTKHRGKWDRYVWQCGSGCFSNNFSC